MNDEPRTDPPEPVSPVDPLDERLSAELDAASPPETEPSAADRDVDAARADDRRRALESARDLLAIPPPPLDDLTRRRMLRVALAEWPHAKRRDPRWLNRVAVAAALVGVVALSGLALKALDNGSGSGSHASKAATRATTLADAGARLDLHEVSDPAVLRRRVEAALRTSPTSTAPQEGPSTTSRPERSGPANADSVGPGARCVATVEVPAGVTPIVLANATFDGAPAVVLVADDDSRTLVYVLATADCRLLSSQFLR